MMEITGTWKIRDVLSPSDTEGLKAEALQTLKKMQEELLKDSFIEFFANGEYRMNLDFSLKGNLFDIVSKEHRGTWKLEAALKQLSIQNNEGKTTIFQIEDYDGNLLLMRKGNQLLELRR